MGGGLEVIGTIIHVCTMCPFVHRCKHYFGALPARFVRACRLRVPVGDFRRYIPPMETPNLSESALALLRRRMAGDQVRVIEVNCRSTARW